MKYLIAITLLASVVFAQAQQFVVVVQPSPDEIANAIESARANRIAAQKRAVFGMLPEEALRLQTEIAECRVRIARAKNWNNFQNGEIASENIIGAQPPKPTSLEDVQSYNRARREGHSGSYYREQELKRLERELAFVNERLVKCEEEYIRRFGRD
jgi:hypothetical protein